MGNIDQRPLRLFISNQNDNLYGKSFWHRRIRMLFFETRESSVVNTIVILFLYDDMDGYTEIVKSISNQSMIIHTKEPHKKLVKYPFYFFEVMHLKTRYYSKIAMCISYVKTSGSFKTTPKSFMLK